MTPLLMQWTGEAMRPTSRFSRMADRQYVVGELYLIDAIEERSGKSHNHYFAIVNQAWVNLPEDIAERFSSSEHLRKFALIKAGFRDERSIVCASKAEALRVAGFVKPLDEYAVVTVLEAVVTVYTAKSQSAKAMGKAKFQESKEAVLGVLAGLIGVEPAALGRAAA